MTMMAESNKNKSKSGPKSRSGVVDTVSSDSTAHWWKRVRMSPKCVRLIMDKRVQLVVDNRSPQRLAFKVKTTRHHSVFPNRTFGFVPPNGAQIVRLLYKPGGTDRPLNRHDHLTVVLKPVSDTCESAHDAWKEKNDSSARGFRIELRDAKHQRVSGVTAD